MDLNRRWTTFAVEAEYEVFGPTRLVQAHNKLISDYDAAILQAEAEHRKNKELEEDITRLEREIERLKATIDSLLTKTVDKSKPIIY